MFIKEAQEPPFAQRGRRDSRVHVTGARVPPRAVPVAGRDTGARGVKAAAHKLLGSGPWSLPLPPQDAAESATKPRIELVEAAADVGHPKVSHPSAKERRQVGDRPLEGPTATCSELKTQPRFQPGH